MELNKKKIHSTQIPTKLMRVEKSKSDESNSQPNVTAELKVNYVLKDFLKISFG